MFLAVFSHLESTSHGFAEPDVLLLSGVLAEVPVLHGDAGLAGVDASGTSLHVAVNLDSIQNRALVGVNPVHACANGGTQFEESLKIRSSLYHTWFHLGSVLLH